MAIPAIAPPAKLSWCLVEVDEDVGEEVADVAEGDVNAALDADVEEVVDEAAVESVDAVVVWDVVDEIVEAEPAT